MTNPDAATIADAAIQRLLTDALNTLRVLDTYDLGSDSEAVRYAIEKLAEVSHRLRRNG